MFEEKLAFSKLKGKTLRSIRTRDGTHIEFELDEGSLYVLDCPRHGRQKDYNYEVVGDIDPLVGVPIATAEISTCDDGHGARFEAWVFYKLCTGNGSVTIRIRGELSGFHSIVTEFLTLRHSRVLPARGCSRCFKVDRRCHAGVRDRLVQDLRDASCMRPRRSCVLTMMLSPGGKSLFGPLSRRPRLLRLRANAEV